METVESVILSQKTLPEVRERLIDVLAAAAFTFHGPDKEGFRSTWKRIRPPNKPKGGIPFEMQDSMFDPTMSGYQTRTLTSPAPQSDPRVTYVNKAYTPPVPPPNPMRQDSEQGHRGRHRGHIDRDLSQPPRRRDYELTSPRESMQMLFEECDVALHNTRILSEALASATPDSFRSNQVIKA